MPRLERYAMGVEPIDWVDNFDPVSTSDETCRDFLTFLFDTERARLVHHLWPAFQRAKEKEGAL